jgi:cobalt-zinc-cadmium efflux system membrane fusion protein
MKRGSPLVLLILVACHRAPAVEKPTAPPGEGRITPGWAQDADLGTVAAGEHEIRVVRVSGRITLDDLHVAHVFSPVDGRVVSVSAELGQHVKKGDVLATIDWPESRRARSEVFKAEAELVAARHDYMRQKDLCKRCGNQRDEEAAEERYRDAKANLERARVRARLLGPGAVIGDPFVLHAPIDGEVLVRHIDSGPVYAPEGGGAAPVPLFTLGDRAQLWAIADVIDADRARVEAGQKVTATVSSFPDRAFEGQVDWVSSAADPTTGLGKVRCTLPNPTGELRPEMDTALVIVIAEDHPGSAQRNPR